MCSRSSPAGSPRASCRGWRGGGEAGQGIGLEQGGFVRRVVAGEERLARHIARRPEEDGAIAFEIYGEGEEEEAPVYSEGRAILVTPRETPPLAVAKLSDGCTQR